ncbi:MAG: DUF1570 domain-containing protein [Pirellulaceae bacterium]
MAAMLLRLAPEMNAEQPMIVPQYNRRPLPLLPAALLGVAVVAIGSQPPSVIGQAISSTHFVSPADFGFRISDGEVRPGDGRCVTTRDEQDREVVARVHADVGDSRIVLLPDGTLVARTKEESPPTDRPFTPFEVDQLAERLTSGDSAPFNGFRVRTSTRYVFVYNTSEEFAQVASRVLESMFRGVVLSARAAGIEVHQPPTPLVVVMFGDEAELQRLRRMPAGMAAYYHTVENRVYLFEKPTKSDLDPELWVREKLSTIAHEGAHQVLCNIGVQQRLSVWPAWLAEGLAEYFAPTSTDKRLNWKGAGEVNNFRLAELEEFLKARDASAADGALVEQTVTAARLNSAGYASAWALVHLLAETRRDQFNRLLADASQMAPLEGPGREFGRGVVPDNLRLLREHVLDEPAELERRLILHLKRLPYRDPYADWPHYVALVSYGNARSPNRVASAFRTSSAAERWRDQQLAGLSAADRRSAEAAVQTFANRLTAERFVQSWLRRR